MANVSRSGLVVAAALAALTFSCGGGIRVRNLQPDATAFAPLKTYVHEVATVAPDGYERTKLTPVVLDEVQRDVDTEMSARGYTLAKGTGDMIVRVSSGARQVEREPSAAALRLGADDAPEDRTEGALVIDIMDKSATSHLFHGVARAVVDPKKPSKTQLAAAVKKILAPLPSIPSAPSPEASATPAAPPSAPSP